MSNACFGRWDLGCLIWRMIASAGILDSGTFFGKKWHAIFRARRVLAKMSRTLAVMNDSLSMAIFEKSGKSPSILVHESSRM